MKKIILLLMISGLCYGQLSPEVNKLYQELSKSKQVESKNIDFDGHESIFYNIHTEISTIAKEQELEYIAFNGGTVAKSYISNILFSRKSKSIEKIFKKYLESNDSLVVKSGCIRHNSFLADEIYKNVAAEKYNINNVNNYTKWKDSLIHSKKDLNNIDLMFMESAEVKTLWKHEEIDSLRCKLDEIVLDNKESPQSIVELICSYYLYEKIKIPYYEKIIYFEKKYNSEYIKDYMIFCRNKLN